MADKGKRPIEQEDFFFSLVDFDFPAEETTPNSSGTDQTYPEDSMKVNPALETAIPDRVPVESLASENGEAILKEMEETEDGFFAKFLRINGVDPQNPEQMRAVLSHQPEALCTIVASGALKITSSMGMPIVPGTIIPPGNKKAAQHEKLLRIYNEDPKRAKRIMLNRLSAQRSREKRKMRKIMLQQKVDALKAESGVLTAQLELAQKTCDSLKAGGMELKGQVETIQPHIQLQESALDKEISNEIEQLRLLIGPVPPCSNTALLAIQELRAQAPKDSNC